MVTVTAVVMAVVEAVVVTEDVDLERSAGMDMTRNNI